MAEYIDRDAVLDFIDGIWDCDEWVETKRFIQDKIALFPVADVVERKRGEWNVRIFGRDGTDAYCSVCGKGGNRPHWNFCPNCGADMRPEGRE